MDLLTFGLSVQCKNKEHINQDRLGWITVRSPLGRDVLVSAVCDGVTMCFRGEVAAYNTVRFILNWAADYFIQNELDPLAVPAVFDKLITDINQNLNHYSQSKNKKAPKDGYSPFSSCTLCCSITDGDKLLYFCVGDSLIYEMKAYSTTNIMSKSKHTNTKGRLTSYVGGIDDDKLDIRYIESKFDDSTVYFLCTDGMNNKMIWDIDANEDFRRFNQRLLSVDSRSKGESILEAMFEHVVLRGETDDITALVFKRGKI